MRCPLWCRPGVICVASVASCFPTSGGYPARHCFLLSRHSQILARLRPQTLSVDSRPNNAQHACPRPKHYQGRGNHGSCLEPYFLDIPSPSPLPLSESSCSAWKQQDRCRKPYHPEYRPPQRQSPFGYRIARTEEHTTITRFRFSGATGPQSSQLPRVAPVRYSSHEFTDSYMYRRPRSCRYSRRRTPG